MKLIDFLNNNLAAYEFQKNFIDLLKIENLYKTLEIENLNKIINISLNCDTSKYTYLQSQIKLRSSNYVYENENDKGFIILSTNPDCDFPPPKKEIISFQDKNFNTEKQDELDNMNYKDKIDSSVIVNLPQEIKQIFCHAVGIENPRVSMVPLGRDYKNRHLFPVVDNLARNEKNTLCYYNCTLPPQVLHWYGMIRTNIYKMIKRNNMNFIDVEYCNMHPRTYNDSITLNYYKKILASKFMICPRGCGIDTYRMWDCIYLGCIPIIEKYEGYNQFNDLPILFIDNWRDIIMLTPDFLERKWQEMLLLDYNYDKLNIDYWENCIRSKI